MLFAALIGITSSCSKKISGLTEEHFSVTPQVLETVGGQVPFTIDGRFPAKFLHKKAVVEVTPVLKWNNGKAEGDKYVFQGESVQGNEKVISYKRGGRFSIKESFRYVPEMERSELFLNVSVKKGSKKLSEFSVKVADGVNSTSELLSSLLKKANLTVAEDRFQRIIQEKKDANIMFLVNQANIRATETKTANKFTQDVKDVDDSENKRVKNIEISAYASPEGKLDLNTKLAENREKNTAKLLNANIKKNNIEDVYVDTKYTAEDWEGFRELVEKSNIPDKHLILRVLAMYTDPAQREQEIRNISSVYQSLADDILPQLRRSRITLNYEIIGKTDHEIKTFAEKAPSKLNVEEFLYAATLTDNDAEKETIYKNVVKHFPNDYRALNNLAVLAYKKGNVEQASEYLRNSMKVQDAPEVNSNLGVISLLKGNKEVAEEFIGRASGSKGIESVMGKLYLSKGAYDKAALIFGDEASNISALAHILNKNYNKAEKTLTEVANPDGYTFYLLSIVGARTNNVIKVVDNLRKAFVRSPELKNRALNDLEFVKFYNSSAFVSLMN